MEVVLITSAPLPSRTAVLLAWLLHLPLLAVALLLLHFGWIVQIPAMGCDTGALLCRADLRSTGEAVATAGPSVVLLVSVAATLGRMRRGRALARIPLLGLLAAMLTIAAAVLVVCASTLTGP